MTEFLPAEHDNNPDAVRQFFAQIIDGQSDHQVVQGLQAQADAAWDAHTSLALTQGNVSGTFGHESVDYQAGSLPGFSIFVNLVTLEGEQYLQLQPGKFEITAIED